MTLAEQWRQEGEQIGIEKGLLLGKEQGLEQGLEQGKEQGLEQGLEQGKEQGLEQGLERGEKVGKLEMVKDMLQLKFGDEARDYFELLESLTIDQLGKTSANLLKFDNLEDVVKDVPG